MTPDQFRLSRQLRSLSQRRAANLLGIGFRTLQRVEDGTYGDPIPLKYENMIAGLSITELAQQALEGEKG